MSTRGLLGACLGLLVACNESVVISPKDVPETNVERLPQATVERIDLLLAIDNSRGMDDKQAILAQAVPDLLLRLTNPLCLSTDGQPLPAEFQPMDPFAECPPGSKRELAPIFDIHLGVVTSSLGGHGSDSCEGDFDASENDHGWLVDRDANGGAVPTWQGKKFLAWDPQGTTHAPAGEANLTALIDNLATMLRGAGGVGCGYESQLESWYRFLVDPDPHQTISIETDANGAPSATLVGTDATLLAMRRDFLRPDSLLAIVMLSDENDCSIRDGGQYFFAAQRFLPGTSSPYRLPKPRAACATNPNDPCCRSCGTSPGCLQYDDAQNCIQVCDDSADDCSGTLSAIDDANNLRCFDQKRRFGIDFLQPIDRYATGLTAPTVPDRNGQLVPNPLFSDLDPSDTHSAIRDPGLVFVAGIVGVPWQDIARRDAGGAPNLLNGFQSASELGESGGWDLILGDPANYVAPLDPLMIESVDPRTGANPVTGDALAPPGDPTGNAINGSEYSVPLRDDLQYACIYALPEPRDCTTQTDAPWCECPTSANEATDKPLCDPLQTHIQVKAKAYPSTRELAVLKAAGSQAIVGSVCPAQIDNAMLGDFGYRPQMHAVFDGVKPAFARCFPRALAPAADGRVACRVVEARRTDASCTDVCSAGGRQPTAADDPVVAAIKNDPLAATVQWNCFCEIAQAIGEDLIACQNDPSSSPVVNGTPVNGWCYVDASTGNPALVQGCPAQPSKIRFVGEGEAAPGATLFLSCSEP